MGSYNTYQLIKEEQGVQSGDGNHEYWVELTASIQKDVVCDWCGQAFAVPVVLNARGTSPCQAEAGAETAEHTTRHAAEEELETQIGQLTGDYSEPCPFCGMYSITTTRTMRRAKEGNWIVGGFLAGILVLFEGLSYSHESQNENTLLLVLFALAAWVVIAWIGWIQSNPNRNAAQRVSQAQEQLSFPADQEPSSLISPSSIIGNISPGTLQHTPTSFLSSSFLAGLAAGGGLYLAGGILVLLASISCNEMEGIVEVIIVGGVIVGTIGAVAATIVAWCSVHLLDIYRKALGQTIEERNRTLVPALITAGFVVGGILVYLLEYQVHFCLNTPGSP